jgi:putative membrane protein insertion efficiency factor
VISRFLGAILIAPIRLYQRFVSPMRPPTCRFYPSCSSYAVQAITVHGPFVGVYLAIKRLFRCHPWTSCGVDQVPPKGRWRQVKPPYDPTEGQSDDDAGAAAATRSAHSVGHASSLILPARRSTTRGSAPTVIQGA